MSRLQSQLRRLYLLPGDDASLVNAAGQVRALVLELTRPADWEMLSAVWRGVQADLALPAPAIAVSGIDGLQLWFSLAEPVSATRAADFLAGLHARYLPEAAAGRLRAFPSAAQPGRHAALVPAPQGDAGNWSAFVAPDLAPVFADTPWLDIPPSSEGQADLLARLQSIAAAAFDAALSQLQSAASPTAAPIAPIAPIASSSPIAVPDLDPRRFLQAVLNDETAPLALRVEAAKALLPSAAAASGPKGG